MWGGKKLSGFVVAGLMCAVCAVQSQEFKGGERVRLRNFVEVNRGDVLLSDLLPVGTPPDLQKESAGRELCRTPRAGSIRELRADEILRKFGESEKLLREIVVPARVVVRNPGRPVEVAAVKDTISSYLQEHGWRQAVIASASLEIPTVVAAGSDFHLQVISAERVRDRVLQVRLRCSDSALCGTFLARMVFAERLMKPVAPLVELEPAACGPVLTEKAKSATLVLKNESARVSLPVICIDQGRMGERIRVKDRKTGRVFAARVVGSQLVEANL